MNNIAMDALNRGWAIGIGTQVHAQDPDLDAALRRLRAAPTAAPRHADDTAGRRTALVRVLLTPLQRRLIALLRLASA